MELLNTPQHAIQPEIVNDRLANGYDLDIGEYLNQGWEIFRREWLLFSLYSLVMIFIVLVASFTIIGLLFVIFPLYLGYYIGADKVRRGEELEFGDFFEGFKMNMPKLALLALIPMIAYALAFLPFLGSMIELENSGDAGGNLFAGSIIMMYPLIFIIAILIYLAFFFAPILIAYGNYGVMDAVKTSWKLSMKQPLYIILFSILLYFINQAGALLCGIGLLASSAFAYVCYYPAIRDVLYKDKFDLKNNIPV